MNVPVAFLMQSDTPEIPAGAGAIGAVFMILYFAVIILMIAGMWKVFTKAGKPGWAAIVPIYNIIVLLEIAGKPLWWFILFFIPFVNFIIFILIGIEVAKKFGKGTGFGIGLALLAPIFYPILGFSDATYNPSA
ncbi:MAG TPA: DUF5684 domain-containing protein [Thermoanaerobaculia bacterium]|nr:DUF5684 domain-containing protein [Thermoanaerobaculia bacterium]